MNKYAFFSKQLAQNLVQADWYFTTLLSVTIESVGELPDDCDALINELLLQHPVKPSEKSIGQFLLSSQHI